MKDKKTLSKMITLKIIKNVLPRNLPQNGMINFLFRVSQSPCLGKLKFTQMKNRLLKGVWHFINIKKKLL